MHRPSSCRPQCHDAAVSVRGADRRGGAGVLSLAVRYARRPAAACLPSAALEGESDFQAPFFEL